MLSSALVLVIVKTYHSVRTSCDIFHSKDTDNSCRLPWPRCTKSLLEGPGMLNRKNNLKINCNLEEKQNTLGPYIQSNIEVLYSSDSRVRDLN